jgi:GNAT superfamily N-acetyltransferase
VPRRPLRIARLCDHPNLLGDIAALYTSVWPAWYGPDGPGDAVADLTERSRATGLPLGLIALSAGQAVGAAALSAQSFGAMAGEGPWLIGLAVDPDFRQQGIATQLVARAEAEARITATWLYCTTDAAATLLLRRGWTEQRRAGEGAERVYRLTL